jgi:hypothetical protein
VVLEAVVTLIKADGEVAVALEPAMMPTLLQVRMVPESIPLPRFAKLTDRRCQRPSSVMVILLGPTRESLGPCERLAFRTQISGARC